MKKIIITLGDPYGIGPEVTFKALKKLNAKDAAFTLIGDVDAFKKSGALEGNISYINITSNYPAPQKREPSKRGGEISFKAVEKAIALTEELKADALITAPISKEAWQSAGVKYMGHTEILRERAGNPGALMMFRSGRLCCGLVTEHYALKDLSEAITKERIKEAAKTLAAQIAPEAFIEISALNPHCGDGDKIGSEEIKTIIPAVRELQEAGINAAGPYPVDALWLRHINAKNDAVLMMYHDAALLGLKLAAKEPVIHITAGLKFLRLSPAHGTAFDIAGQNAANESSMLAAIEYALQRKQ